MFKFLYTVLTSYKHVTFNVFRSELHSRYHGTVLGILWSMINPLAMMIGIGLIFPILLKQRTENYIIFLFAGIVVWQFIASAVVGGANSINSKRLIIDKVYLPKIIFPSAIITVELVNLVAALVALHIISFIFSLETKTNIIYLIFAIVITYIFALGISYCLSILTVYFRDLGHILSVSIQAAFYLTPVIYPLVLIPEEYRFYMYFNPLYYFVEIFHQAVYVGENKEWSVLLQALGISIVVFVIGSFVQSKYDRLLVYRL